MLLASGYFPPPEFDYKPSAEVHVIEGTPEQVRHWCPEHGVACIYEANDAVCVIIFNKEYEWARSMILRHEYGHCNGWPSDHPGAR